MKNTVCIIGAGLAGLVTAKVLKNDGFDVTVFDKESTIGGVWAPSRTYVGLSTNNPREHYAFSDYSYPQSCDEFPSAAQVLRYLQNYAWKFGLEPHINLSTEVASVSCQTVDDKESHPEFDVLVRPVGESTEVQAQKFDYIVMCNGVFSKPYIPQLEGQELFDGSLIHLSEMVDRAMLHGKRVVVVGAGKSALDCATVVANEADPDIFPSWCPPGQYEHQNKED